MAQNDLFKRYLDTGLAFTAVTQARAEALVKDLVKAGEVQADQAREVISDLVDRSRKNSEQLLETVRREVKQQITSLGLVSKADLDKAEARIATLMGTASAPVRKVAESGSKAAAKAAGQASSAAKQATGASKKSSTKAAPAKKAAAAKKTPAKKAPAKKAPAKKA